MDQPNSSPTKPIKIPGSDHPIAITRHPRRVVVKLGGRIVADTRDALRLAEASYSAVFYIPRKDADMAALVRNDHSTYCPYKGDASYFSGAHADNAAWSYEQPHASVAEIKDHLAFYPDRVDSIEEFPAE